MVSVNTTQSCGGCTTGGFACFGQNSCTGGCVEEQTRDCCGAKRSSVVCCSSCGGNCQPNVPCGGATKPNQVIRDTCAPVPGVPAGCQYYSRRSACLGGKCAYYVTTAPAQCKKPPFTVGGVSPAKLECIRQCLQVADAQLGPSDMTAKGCARRSSITKYHNTCFSSCGVPRLLFPDLWWIFAEDDGD